MATFKSTNTQNANSDKLAAAQYDLSEKHHSQNVNLAVTEKFFLLMEKSTVCQTNNRIDFLISESAPGRADELRDIFLKHCNDQTLTLIEDLENSSKIAVENAKLKEIRNLVHDLQGAGRGIARTRLTDLYEQNQIQVSEELSNAIESNYTNYRTTLGVLVVLGSVDTGWKPTEPLITQFNELAKSPNYADDTFEQWYEKAEKNKKE